MEFTITKKVDFDIEYLANRMIEDDDSFTEALEAGDVYSDYLELEENEKHDLKLAVFKEAVALLTWD